MKNLISLVGLALCVAVLSHCAKNDDIGGEWLSACKIEVSTGIYLRNRMKFNANKFEAITEEYTVADCSGNPSKTNTASSGTFELKKDIDPSNRYRGLDWTIGDTTTYDIYKLDNQNNTLVFGTTASSTADTRPRTLSANVYTRAK